MTHYQWQTIPIEVMNPLVSRQVIHTDRMTFCRISLKKGASVAMHSHPNEQVSFIESGSLRFVLDGTTVIVKAGEILVIPGGKPHSADADEDCVALDAFTPVREDWLRGDDAYLRGR